MKTKHLLALALVFFGPKIALALQPGTICVGKTVIPYDSAYYQITCNKVVATETFLGLFPTKTNVLGSGSVFTNNSEDRENGIAEAKKFHLSHLGTIGDNSVDLFVSADVQFDPTAYFICVGTQSSAKEGDYKTDGVSFKCDADSTTQISLADAQSINMTSLLLQNGYVSFANMFRPYIRYDILIKKRN